MAGVAARLATAGIPTPEVDARWLVEAATEDGRLDADRLEAMVLRRLSREPLQTVVGSTRFRFVTLACRSGVFIPRPETEVVAGVAIEAAAAVQDRRAVVVDACAGTGAIALAVASEVPRARVVAAERDPAALELARDNVAAVVARTPGDDQPWRPGDRLAPGATVEVVASDLLSGIDASLQAELDVLVANPPYLPAIDRGSWSPEVADHDPDTALVGGADGHEVVDELLRLARAWLRPGGTVVVEIDDRRGGDALARADAAGLVDVRLVADLAGRDRAVVGRRRAPRGTMAGDRPRHDRGPAREPDRRRPQ